MASHSSILARRIPWTEDPGGLQSWGHKRDTTGPLSAGTSSAQCIFIVAKDLARGQDYGLS